MIDWRRSRILIGFIIFLSVLSSPLSVQGEPENESICSDILGIIVNSVTCDSKEVSVNGIVDDYKSVTSRQGNKYTTFYLVGGNNRLMVFSFEHLDVINGDLVRVTGVFRKQYEVNDTIYYDEIITSSNHVSIIKPSMRWLKWIVGAIGVFVLICVIWYYKYYKPMDIGRKFQKYALSLFDDKEWKVSRYASDMSLILGRIVKGDSNPDFDVQHRQNEMIIAIECKYARLYSEGRGSLERKLVIENHKLVDYKTYQTESGMQTYVLFGVGGKPNNPKDMYLIPLSEIYHTKNKYRHLPESWFSQFEVKKQGFHIEDFIVS